MNTTASRLGQLLAVALLGLVVAFVFDASGTPLQRDEQNPRARAESTQAFQAAMWGAAGLAFAGAAVSGFGLRRGRSGGAPLDSALKEHLALYDRQHRAAFVGDAIHGRGCPKAAGGMAIPVTYYRVDIYLSTLRYFESLAIDVLYSGHWPVTRGEQVRDFIAESRQTVELFDRVILAGLEKMPMQLAFRPALGTKTGGHTRAALPLV